MSVNAVYDSPRCRRAAFRRKERARDLGKRQSEVESDSRLVASLQNPTLAMLAHWTPILRQLADACGQDRGVEVLGVMPEGWTDDEAQDIWLCPSDIEGKSAVVAFKRQTPAQLLKSI